jgi:hypothetical protein
MTICYLLATSEKRAIQIYSLIGKIAGDQHRLCLPSTKTQSANGCGKVVRFCRQILRQNNAARINRFLFIEE